MKQKSETDALFVEEGEAHLRLDKFLSLRYPKYSRTYFQDLIAKGLVLLNGEIAKKRTLLNPGDDIEIEFALPPEIALIKEPIPLDILYEDESVIAINKPSGMVVHPGAGNFSGTFVNALLYHCSVESTEDNLRPGIVHRLDKETTGVLIAAKTEFAQRELVKQFSERTVEKNYLAICLGNPGKQVIKTLIGRHPVRRQEMAVVKEKGKEAITQVETESFDGKLALVKLKPLTGRTHQLRVHLKALKCPILGDRVYGNTYLNQANHVARQLLHAEKLTFLHPKTHTTIEIKAPIPDDIQKFIAKIQNYL